MQCRSTPPDWSLWGDRCGTIVDPDGYTWMIGTHPRLLANELKKGTEEMMKQQPASAAADDYLTITRKALVVR